MRREEKMRVLLHLLAEKTRLRASKVCVALKDYPPPWVNLTHVWNAAQEHYFLRNGRHWHGPLRGAKKRSAKHCSVLIVVDDFQGERIKIDPATWNGFPDYYDLRKIVAEPHDELFRGRTSVHVSQAIAFDDYGVADLVVDAVNRAWKNDGEHA